jgi:ABC-2 type transport system permease protein
VSATATVLAIAGTELRRVLRDRMGLFFLVVLPVLVIVVIGSSIDASQGPSQVGVVDLDGSEASAALLDDLAGDGALTVVRIDDLDALSVDVRLARLEAGLVVPPGFGDRVDAGTPVELTMVVDPSRASSTTARTAVGAVLDRFGAERAAAAFATAKAAAPPAEAGALARRTLADQAPTRVQVVEVGEGGLDSGSPYRYPAAANLVLFTFINSLAVAGVIVESRRLGVTRRVLAGPVAASTLVVGYATSRFVLALLQGLVVVVAGVVLFGVPWGDPVAVAALLVSFSAVAAAAAVLIGAIARTPEQTQSFGIPLGIAMGMLGGALWPLELVPPWLRQIGHLTPHAWAMDGWIAVVFDGAGVPDIAVELGVLAAFGIVLGAIGATALRRSIAR